MAQDDGASLVIALIITTVVALVVGAVLGLSGASVNATVATTTQARSTAAADAATQVAINAVQNNTYNNDLASATYPKCFGNTGTSDSMVVPYPGGGGSTYVTCAPDPGSGAAGGSVPVTNQNKPGQAILTLGTSSLEDGQVYGQSNKAIYVRGSVLSNSTINSQKADFHVIGPGAQVKAIGACSGPITPACTTITTPQSDPNYPLPANAPAPPTGLPPCTDTKKVANFLPGLYTTADTFNNCKSSWFYFSPGTYFFDFTTGPTHIWTLNNTAVGGTLTAAETDAAPAVPGACVNPIESASAVGVQLVFGGDSQLILGKSIQAEFCATYQSAVIPTVLYGLKSSIVNGSNTAHAQSGCVILVAGCDLISDGGNGTKPTFFFEGFVYAPMASINIAVNNTTKPFFNFGLVVRSLQLSTTGSACTPPACPPFISLPDNSPGLGVGSTIIYLTVYDCPGAGTCSSSGRLRLRSRVLVYDPSGTPVAGSRTMNIQSWAVVR